MSDSKDILAQNIFQGFTNEAAKVFNLQTEIAIKQAEIDNLSKQVAASGEIIAEVKRVCAADADLMEFIDAKLKLSKD